MDTDIRSWSRAKCEEVIHTCRITAVDGTTLFTPDGVGHYGAYLAANEICRQVDIWGNAFLAAHDQSRAEPTRLHLATRPDSGRGQ